MEKHYEAAGGDECDWSGAGTNSPLMQLWCHLVRLRGGTGST